MNRLLAVAVSATLVATLSACQRPSSSQAAAPAASKAGSGAADDSLQALTRIAFPDWKGQGGIVLQVPPYQQPNELMTIAATPTLVVDVDATHRALVMVGTPSDEQGREDASHAEGGNLGVYGFELRDGRWTRTTTQPSVLWGGSSGVLGDVKPVDLGPGHPALAIEGGWVGQGYVLNGLALVAIEPAGARVVLPNVQLHSDSLGVADGCEDWLAKGRAPSADLAAALTPDNCFDVTGTWRVQPVAGAERGDIVIVFTGHRLATDGQGESKSVQAVAGTLVYRYGKSGYEKASGENLAPEV